MNKCSYIIATYEGPKRSNKAIADRVLNEQFVQLFNLLKNKEYYKVDNNIIEVIVVKPYVKEENRIKNYYRFDVWQNGLDRYDVDLIILDYVGQNKDYSYDQWLQGINIAKGDYYIFSEDDHYLDPDNVNIEQDIINTYKEIFKDNIGYLCSAAWTDKYHGYHAAISNGIISKDTVKKYDNILEEYYSKTYSNAQVKFSHLFLQRNIPIKDYRAYYKVLFWQSIKRLIIDYSEENVKSTKHIFKPAQCVIG